MSVSAAPAPAGDFCGSAKAINDHIIENPTVDIEANPLPGSRTALVSELENGVAMYEPMVAAAPAEIVDEVTVMRDVTQQSLDAARTAPTNTEFYDQLMKLATTTDLLDASVKVNAFLKATCGFEFVDNDA